MLDLKALNIEELKRLREQVAEEITARASGDLVLYTHNCKDRAKHHKNKYKHWAKLVESVDTTKTSGYAFIGEWLNLDYEHKIPKNSIVVEVCDTTITAYEITGDEEKKEIDSAETRSMSKFIERIASII